MLAARTPTHIVPCHRVVRSDGSLGGYSAEGGVETKRRLLSDEGVDLSTLKHAELREQLNQKELELKRKEG
jgi:alkylated DNA nucleotide flippase Atl1